MSRMIFGAALVAAMAVTTGTAIAEQRFVSVGTGGVTGVYYPTGGAICRLVNKGRKTHGIRCSAEATDGSIHNLNAIRAGEMEFGVAQSDWQYHAYHGTSEFAQQGPHDGLRSVFSIHPEPVTIIARTDSGVTNISDLKGKRLNIGNPGSGTRGTWDVIEQALGWSRSDLKLAAEMKSAETGQAICDNQIDGYFWLAGHPSALTEETLATCDARLVNVTGPAITRLVADNPYYRTATIPAGMYGDNPAISTFGVGATFVTSADVPDDVVYTIVKAVFDNLDQFRQMHPAFGTLDQAEMIHDGLSAPLHPGAIRYYKERGWM